MLLLFLADLLLVIHFLYVLCIIVPVPLVLMGKVFRWSFVLNSWFRNIHLLLVGIMMGQTLLGIACPWTTWEEKLRLMAGKQGYGGSFISYWVSRLLYYNFEPWVFKTAYLAFGVLILVLYFVFPPQWLARLKGKI